MILQTPTAIRNLAQIPSSASAYITSINDVTDALGKVFSDKSLGQRALAAGSVKSKYKGFDMPVSDIEFEAPLNKYQEVLGKASDFMRKWSGRDLSDKIEGTIFHALGEVLAEKAIKTKDTSFLKKFGSAVDKVSTKKASEFTPEDIQKIAQDFTSQVRGTYDARTLPSAALRGQLAPFLSLNRWSLSKANTQMRDVVEPLKKGNWAPFLKVFITALGAGYGIEELNQVLNGKRPQDSTTEEVMATGDTMDYAEKAVDLLQLSGFLGIISDMSKLSMRLGRGKDIQYSNPISFPTYTLLSDTAAKNVGQAVNAIGEGEDPLKVLEIFAKQFSSGMMQNARAIRNWSATDETERKAAFRDYNVWQELTGRKDPEVSANRSNEYRDIESKKFKRTGDLNEAGQMLGPAIEDAFEKAKLQDGTVNIFALKKKLQNLKRNSYQVMPNVDEDPISFAEYYNYLVKTQGQEKANERLSNFISQREVNKIKNQMVPSLD
jgi:hypothetical protein